MTTHLDPTSTLILLLTIWSLIQSWQVSRLKKRLGQLYANQRNLAIAVFGFDPDAEETPAPVRQGYVEPEEPRETFTRNPEKILLRGGPADGRVLSWTGGDMLEVVQPTGPSYITVADYVPARDFRKNQPIYIYKRSSSDPTVFEYEG